MAKKELTESQWNEKRDSEVKKLEGILKQVQIGTDYHKELTGKIEKLKARKFGEKSLREKGLAFSDKLKKIGLNNIGDSVSEINLSIYGKTKEEIKSLLKDITFLWGRDSFAPCNLADGFDVERKDSKVILKGIPSK